MKKRIFISVFVLGIFASIVALLFFSKEEPFEAVYQDFTEDEIRYENGTLYVDSQILLTAVEGTSKKEIQKLIEPYDGKIVGFLPVTNDYQILFSKKKSLDELNAIIDVIKKSENIESASLHSLMKSSISSIKIPNDPWINTEEPKNTSGLEWSLDKSEGNNWWAEAIMMPLVWAMDVDDFSSVKVGIIDSMFDILNEDLDGKFVKTWNNPIDENGKCFVSTLYEHSLIDQKNNKQYYHGTHVSGIIGAQSGNDYGIAGISQNAELYGYADSSKKSYQGLFGWKYAISLMLQEDVKIINISETLSEELFVAAQKGVPAAIEDLESYSNTMENFLLKYINNGYDFLIVKSAGNLNGSILSKKGWFSCEESIEHIYGYRQIDEKEDGVVNEVQSSTDFTEYDARYDVFGAIEDEIVKKHILIIGAAENHKTYYKKSNFSVTGERIDVYAPGTSILSCMPGNSTAILDGTSMSTPIVTGIASLIWGINPELTSDQVRDIIVCSVDARGYREGSNDEDEVPIVNAYSSVILAQNTIDYKDTNKQELGVVFGLITTTQDDEGNYNAISNCNVYIYSEKGKLIEEIIPTKNDLKNKNNNQYHYYDYTAALSPGLYTIIVEADGYVSQSKSVNVHQADVIEQSFYMKPTEIIAKVFDQVTGQTINNAQCEISSSDNGNVITQKTVENGLIKIELASGKYQISFSADGYKTITQEFVINAHEDTNIGEIQMERKAVTYSGRVYNGDTGTPYDTLLSEVSINFKNKDSGKEYSIKTQDDGSFSIDIPIGRYSITLNKDSYQTKTIEEDICENISNKTIVIYSESAIDLMNYIGTDILDFANKEGNFKVVGTSSGGIELSSDSLILSGMELKIDYINIRDGKRYTYGDLKIGMDWDSAEMWLINRFWNIEDSYGSYIRLYNTRQYGSMGINLDENNRISAIWYSSDIDYSNGDSIGYIDEEDAYNYLKEYYASRLEGSTVDELVKIGAEGSYYETVVRQEEKIIYNISINTLCSCVTEEDVSTGKCRNYIVK